MALVTTVTENILHDGLGVREWTGFSFDSVQQQIRDSLHCFEELKEASLLASSLEKPFLLVEVDQGILQDQSGYFTGLLRCEKSGRDGSLSLPVDEYLALPFMRQLFVHKVENLAREVRDQPVT